MVKSWWTRPHCLSRAHSSWLKLAFRKRGWLNGSSFIFILAVYCCRIDHYQNLINTLFTISLPQAPPLGGELHLLIYFWAIISIIIMASMAIAPLQLHYLSLIGHSTTMPCFPARTAFGLHKELPSLCSLFLAVIHHCTSDTYTPGRMCQGSDDKRQLFLPGVSLYDLTRILQGSAYVEELWIQTAWVQTPTLPLTKLFEPWAN